MKIALIFTTIMYVSIATAVADDGFFAIGLGGAATISHTNDVAMEKETLAISKNLVKVDFIFRNLTNHSLDVPMMFPLPPQEFYDPYLPREQREPFNSTLGFEVSNNGHSQLFTIQVIAQLCQPLSSLDRRNGVQMHCEDVTSKLRAMGLTDGQIGFIDEETRFNSLQLKQMRAEMLLSSGSYNTDEPLWAADISYLWTMHLSSRGTSHVTHQYAPLTSTGAYGDFNASGSDQQFCIDRHELRDGNNTEVDYILRSANSWAGPIRDFTLHIMQDNSQPANICFAAPLHQLKSGTLEAHIRNFVPKSDLIVDFIKQ